jgi:hypothetical protein
MAKARTVRMEIGGKPYDLRWDMHAIAVVEELTGENALAGFHVNVRNIRAVIWAALDAAAAVKNEPAPITYRQIGSFFEDDEAIAGALVAFNNLINDNSPEAPKSANPRKPARAKRAKGKRKRSPSAGATRSAASTSDSASGTSGS